MRNGLENIGEIFKQAFDGFESNVDPSVWNNIQNAIGSGANSTPQSNPSAAHGIVGKSLALKIIAGVVLVGSVVTATYFVLPKENKNVIAENIAADNKVNESTEITNHPVIQESNIIKEEKVIATEKIVKETTSDIKVSLVEKETNVAPVTDITPQTEIATPSSKASDKIVAPSNSVTMDGGKEKTQENNSIISNTESKVENEAKNNTIETESTEKPVTQTEEFKIVIPNVITPNGDGMNDVIKISSENIEKLEVVIMDKTGKPLFTFKTIEDVFEGKDQAGYRLLPGVYYMAGVIVDNNGNPHSVKQTINILK